MDKLAVIGTGAAGLGVLSSLLDKKANLDIVVYDIGQEPVGASPPDDPSEEWITSFYDDVYKEIRSLHPFKFPPPKTHFGKQIPRQPVGQRLNIFKSESFGGLTNYWGATMLPFTDREMAKWPISKEILYPYYQKIAETVGLAAEPDALNEYFIRDFSTRPAIKAAAELNKLSQTVNGRQNKDFKIIAGLNRCGLETREDHPNHCVYCGECLAGCFRGSIYSARLTIRDYLKNPRIKYIKARVKRVNKKSGSLEIETDNKVIFAGFSRVFLCAGCPGSTEIVMRSLGLRNTLTMADNAVYVFPIFYLGKKTSKRSHRSYLSLCNLILGCIPKTAAEHFAQAQIYPNFNYLWRYNIPPKLWPIIQPLISFFRPRVFWGRLFVHSDYSQAYSLELKNDKLTIDEIKRPESGDLVKALMSSIRDAVNHKGFYIPPIPPIRQKVNSHYSSTMPFNNKVIGVSSLGEVMPGVYLCDSACFPDSPAVNPGFTIMANAYRIADGASN